MSERDVFDRIVAALYEGALDDAHWPAASALIDDGLRAKGNGLVFGARHPEEAARIFYAGFFRRGRRRRGLERLYFDGYYPRDERVPRLRRLPDSQLVHVTDLYTDEELKTSPTYNEALALGDGQNSLNVRMDGPAGSRIVWVINDPVDSDGWSSGRIDSIRRLLPHLRQHVIVRHALAGAGALGASLDELLDTTGLRVIQLDWRARIIAANDRARELLRAGEALFDEDGFLSARSPVQNVDLQGLLTRALPPFGAQGAAGTMTVWGARGACSRSCCTSTRWAGETRTSAPGQSRRWCWSWTREPRRASIRVSRRRVSASRRRRAGSQRCWPRARPSTESPRRRSAR